MKPHPGPDVIVLAGDADGLWSILQLGRRNHEPSHVLRARPLKAPLGVRHGEVTVRISESHSAAYCPSLAKMGTHQVHGRKQPQRHRDFTEMLREKHRIEEDFPSIIFSVYLCDFSVPRWSRSLCGTAGLEDIVLLRRLRSLDDHAHSHAAA